MFRLLASFLFAASLCLLSETIVKNGFFDEGKPAYGAVPPSWTMEKPAAGGWGYVNDDGVDSATSVRFTASDGAGRLFQKVRLRKETDYTLLFWYKCDRAAACVTLTNAEGLEFCLRTSNTNGGQPWIQRRMNFRSGNKGEYTLFLEGNGDGKVGFDSIEILPQAEAAKRPQPLPALNVKNIALHKKYTMSKDPDYALCKDPDDAIQLTDGVYTKGYFWTQKSTVGWHRNKQAVIIVDLEKTEPICGASWSCAAGTAGVYWPSTIWVFASEDRENWQVLGDLSYLGIKGKNAPDNSKYSVFAYKTFDFRSRGRYVAFLTMAPGGGAVFCDEIEVYRGSDEFLKLPLNTDVKAKDGDFSEFLNKTRAVALVRKRLSLDLADVMDGLVGHLDSSNLDKITALVSDYNRGINAISLMDDIATKSSEMPLDNYPLSAKIFALNAYAQRAKGFKEPFTWKTNRWENVSLIGNAPDDKQNVALSITMMRGEVRSDAFSIANPTDNPQEFTIDTSAVESALGVKVFQVVVTDTTESALISSALRELPIAGGKSKVVVPAGCNVQIWLMCYKPTAKAGSYSAAVKVVGAKNATVKLDVEVVDFDFPKDPQLNVGGWEYAGVYNEKNRLSNIAFMREIGVNCTWNRTEAMPMNPKFDEEGHLVNAAELDFTQFDAWINDWPGAHYYCIAHFMSRAKFFGEKANTPRYENMVIDYYKALEGRMLHHGLKQEQLVYLYFDEPSSQEQDKIIIDFLKIVRKGKLKMQFFQDPTWPYPEKGMPEAFSLSDILCPNTPMMTGYGKPFKEFYNKQREDGRTLWLYSCSGPAKQLDPLHYWRGQAWQCHQMKAVGSFFWAFGCTGGTGDSWNIYVRTGKEFGPYFVSQDDAPTDAKQGEAIRESVADFEYLKMLEAEVARVKAANPKHPALAEAEKALAEAPAEVVAAINMDTFKWNAEKDYGLFDRNAVRVLKALAALKK